MKFEYSHWLVYFLLIFRHSVCGFDLRWHLRWLQTESLLLSQSQSLYDVVSSATNEHTFWPQIFQSASLNESCFFVRFVLISITSYSFHQTHSAMMTIPPNDMHALQCCQLRITKSDQLLIKLLATFSLQMVHLLTKRNQAENPLSEIIHILWTSEYQWIARAWGTIDFPFLLTIHFELYDDLLPLEKRAPAMTTQNINWLSSALYFSLLSTQNLAYADIKGAAGEATWTSTVLQTNIGEFHFSYPSSIPWPDDTLVWSIWRRPAAIEHKLYRSDSKFTTTFVRFSAFDRFG
jgi:hypothetical protein